MKLLTEEEYLASMAEPMRRLSSDEAPPIEFWDYFDAIPESHFEGHDCSAGQVTNVWKHPAGLYQHVLVNSDDKNVFMVLILDLSARCVFGHRLLDLRKEYGLI